MSDPWPRAIVLKERDDVPLPNVVERATVDALIGLYCPHCDTRLHLGPWTGPHDAGLPWLASLCPACGTRFRVVQRIEITWQGGAA